MLLRPTFKPVAVVTLFTATSLGTAHALGL